MDIIIHEEQDGMFLATVDVLGKILLFADGFTLTSFDDISLSMSIVPGNNEYLF